MTQLHLVGGFLGSGKTTAIAAAARQMMDAGLRVGVVTNDQGKYLVDTLFFSLQDMPTVEVSGGCFCCGYDDFAERLAQLRDTAQPDVIFAESVGSCADLVATVIKPLLDLRQIDLPPTSFSVFVDIRLLQRRLRDQSVPFSDNVVYLFDQQIAEAGLLVINKIDLVSPDQANAVEYLAKLRYPDKSIWMQSSLDAKDVRGWADLISAGAAPLPTQSLDIDYERYGRGEAQLAWVDQQVEVTTGDTPLNKVFEQLIARVHQSIGARGRVAHLKFVASDGQHSVKVSFTALPEDGWERALDPLSGTEGSLLINARVEMDAETLRDRIAGVLQDTAQELGASLKTTAEEAFHPAIPRPRYRM